MSELAEGARLEIACAANRGTEGSNPSLSAIHLNVLSSPNAVSSGFLEGPTRPAGFSSVFFDPT